jgi:surfeit locus 1 family protein
MAALLALALAVTAALGLWQLQRRAWKHALVETVAARLHAAPVAPPHLGPDPGAAREMAYLRVSTTGKLSPLRIGVQANTALGPGYWLFAPLLQPGQAAILLNLGFVEALPAGAQGGGKIPAARAESRAASPEMPEVQVTGLLRPSEAALPWRRNDPPGGRWRSRDTAAIAGAMGLGAAEGWFLDVQSLQGAPDEGARNQTVVAFTDNHLAYALTWFSLTGMSALALWRLKGLRSADGTPDQDPA